MKKYYMGMIIGIFLIAMTFESQAQKDQKFGVVDLETIVQQLPEAKKAEEDLMDLSKKYQDTLLQMQKDLEEKYKSYQQQKGMMTPEAQQEEESALQAMNNQVLGYREQIFGMQGMLAAKREEMLAPIEKKVRAAIEEVAKEENLKIVLNKVDQLLLYSDDSLDITFRVLDKLKRGKG